VLDHTISPPEIEDMARKEESLKAREEAWRAAGPLRRYRTHFAPDHPRDEPLSIYDIASRLGGVSVGSVHKWEWGVAMPRRAYFDALARLTGNTDFEADYRRWFADRPTV